MSQRDFGAGVQRGLCAVCLAPARLACSRCRVDFYCTKEHQQQHWRRHRKGCGAVEVPASGGWLTATRDIPAGTRILREVPIALFPRLPNFSEPLCCRSCAATVVASQACADCGLPMCRPDCDAAGHHRLECRMVKGLRYKERLRSEKPPKQGMSASYGLNTLRVYLWLMDHLDMEKVLERNMEASPAPNEFSEGAWRYAQEWLTDGNEGLGIYWPSEKKLRRACRLAVRCALLFHSPESSVAAVHLGHALCAQSCRPNTFDVLLTPEGMPPAGAPWETVLVTARAVRRGERITVDHLDDPLKRASMRRRELAQIDMASCCACALCAPGGGDPGLHLESWPCSKCPGEVVPLPAPAQKPGAPLETCWISGAAVDGRCESCGNKVPAGAVDMAVANLECQMELLVSEKAGPERWQAFLERHLRPRGQLLSGHMLAQRARLYLADALTVADQGICLEMEKYPMAQLVAWEKMLKDLLSALDAIRPGLGCQRWKALFPLAKVLINRVVLLWKDDNLGSEAKALLDELKGLANDLEVFAFGKEWRRYVDFLHEQHRIWSRAIAGASEDELLAEIMKYKLGL